MSTSSAKVLCNRPSYVIIQTRESDSKESDCESESGSNVDGLYDNMETSEG